MAEVRGAQLGAVWADPAPVGSFGWSLPWPLETGGFCFFGFGLGDIFGRVGRHGLGASG